MFQTGRLSVVAILAVGLFVGAGCAGVESRPSESHKALHTQPFSQDQSTVPYHQSKPLKLSVKWRKSLDIPGFWYYDPRQYSAPALFKSSDRPVVLAGTAAGQLVRIWGDTGRISWSRDVTGPVVAEPVVEDGKVFVGTVGGTFYVLESKSGELIWSRHVQSSFESKVATGQGRVYVQDSTSTVRGYNIKQGNQIWRYDRTLPESFGIQGTGAPAFYDGTVYVGFADGYLVALDAETGNVEWKTDLSGQENEFMDVDLAPIVDGEHLVVASYSGGVYRIKRSDGSIDWHRKISGISELALENDLLYVASSEHRIYSLRAGSGETKWRYDTTLGTPTGVKAVGPFVFMSTSNGPLVAVDKQTGIPLTSWNPSNGFAAGIRVGQRKVYAFSNSGVMYGVELGY